MKFYRQLRLMAVAIVAMGVAWPAVDIYIAVTRPGTLRLATTLPPMIASEPVMLASATLFFCLRHRIRANCEKLEEFER